jgi:tetratricopeptide (TPR) repeat protein
MAPPGIVAGRFVIERLAGSGGMGHVYRALDRETGEPAAVKILHGGDAARFAREAEILAGLRHPAIVRYLAHGDAPDGAPFLAMEWLDGEDLGERLRRGALDERDTLALAVAVAGALALAHARGVVHRDIKPQNLFLPGGDPARVKVLDFGVARLAWTPSRGATRTGAILGTPGYMAPEQLSGARGVDARADVFSLGAVLFECVTGQPAFPGEHVMTILAKVLLEEPPRARHIQPGISRGLDELLARALAKDPEARPEGGAALAAEIANLAPAGPESLAAPRMTLPPRSTSLTAGEQRRLFVILAAGGDTLVETLTPEQSSSQAERLRAIAATFGVRLDVLHDGAVIAALEARGAATDQAAIAARCALSVRAELGAVTVALGTGLGSLAGSLPVGEVIDRAVFTLRAAGDRAGCVVVDDATAALLEGRFELAGEAGVRWIAREHGGAAAPRTLLGRPTPCVGREREMATLEAVVAEAADEGVARAVLVTAPAGAGKSRLLHELVASLGRRRAGALVWIARGDPMRAGSPYGMIGDMLRGAASIDDGDPGAALGAALAELAGVEGAIEGADAAQRGERLRRAWVDLLAAETAARPVVLVFDDLHWGDLPTVKLVDAALRELRDRPLVAFAFGRPEVHERFPRLFADRDLLEIRLPELTRRASERLARMVLESGVPAAVVDAVVSRAAGNAFYLEELIRAVAEGRGEGLPDTVLAMTQARLERLDPAVRRVLRAASILGDVFWRGAVLALLGGDPGVSFPRDLCERELLTALGEGRFRGEEEYAFRHALLREAAYATLTEADRALGHRLAGEWLERAGETNALVLAEHFERGGEPARAVSWYRRAAEQALAGNDLQGTVDRAERGVACGASGDELGALRVIEMDACLWRGDFLGAERCGAEALPMLARGSGGWCRAAGPMLWFTGELGHVDRAAAVAGELLGWLAEHDLELRSPGDQASFAAGLAIVSAAMQASGQHQLAAQVLERLDRATAGAGDPTVAGWRAFAGFYRAHFGACDPGASLALAREGAAAFDRAGHLLGLAMTRSAVGVAELGLGAFAGAAETLAVTVEGASQIGAHYWTAWAMLCRGVALGHLGETAAARRDLGAAIEAFSQRELKSLAAYGRARLAEVLAREGDLEGALAQALSAVSVRPMASAYRIELSAILAELLLALGRHDEALASARRGVHLLESLGGAAPAEVRARLSHAEALEATGAGARAELALARDRLMLRADRIADPALRRRFLEEVPENARTLRRAAGSMG